MKKITVEKIKDITSRVIAYGTLVILALAIIFGIVKNKQDNKVLEGGNIQHAIETNQY
jgi:hypothetical protein